MTIKSFTLLINIIVLAKLAFGSLPISNTSRCFRDFSFDTGYPHLMMIPLIYNSNYTHAIVDAQVNIHLFHGGNQMEVLNFPDGSFNEARIATESPLKVPPIVDMVQVGTGKDLLALSFSNLTYNVVYIWNLTDGQIKTKFKRHESKIVSITYLEIYDKIASVSDKGVIYLWEYNRGHIWRQYKLNTATFKIIAVDKRSILAVITEKPALGYTLDIYAVHTTMDFDLMVSHLLISKEIPNSIIYLNETDYLMLGYNHLNALWIFSLYDKTVFQVQMQKMNTGFYKSGLAYDAKKGLVYAMGRDNSLHVLERFNTTFLEKSAFPDFEDKAPVGYVSLGVASRLYILQNTGFTSFQKDKNHFIFEQKTCLLYCPEGYYPNVKECAKCHFTCGRCKGPSFDDCLKCGLKPADEFNFFFHSTCVKACPANSQMGGDGKSCECATGYFQVQDRCESINDLRRGNESWNENRDFDFLEGRRHVEVENKTVLAIEVEKIEDIDETSSLMTILALTFGIPLTLLIIALIMILLFIHFNKDRISFAKQDQVGFTRFHDSPNIGYYNNSYNPEQSINNNMDMTNNNSVNNIQYMLSNLQRHQQEGFDITVNNEASFMTRNFDDTNRFTKDSSFSQVIDQK